MPELLERIRNQAKNGPRTIVLPETQDDRVIQAAVKIQSQSIAKVLLLGDPNDLAAKLKQYAGSAENFLIRDPQTDPQRDELAQAYYELRKHKGITPQEAQQALADPVFFGAMLMKTNQADGLVSGSLSPTARVLRAALKCLGPAKGVKTVSSYSIMTTKMTDLGTTGSFPFADPGVVPEPTAQQLADIALATAQNCRAILQDEPRVAMISFSSKGSARHPSVAKVVEATHLAKQANPDLIIDGELQIDAAIVESVCRRKAPDSPVAGRANVLVFPNLSCANSAYKLAERLGQARAIGPILQGIAKQLNDLSRGCSVQDIVDLTALTCLQAQLLEHSSE